LLCSWGSCHWKHLKCLRSYQNSFATRILFQISELFKFVLQKLKRQSLQLERFNLRRLVKKTPRESGRL
jgi:hypothetical protein